MKDTECVAFLQWALPRLRMRWPGFRRVRRQVCRRIARRIRELGLPDVAAYRELLAVSGPEWTVLDGLCRVTITRFYRDRGVFECLRLEILPLLVERVLAQGRSELRCWSAGCASGEEPYSVAIAWRFAPVPCEQAKLRVIGTDTDETLLERARQRIYPAGCLRELSSEWRARCFDELDGAFRLRRDIANDVELLVHDVRDTPPDGPYDLVLCRNLAFTYFDEELQRETLSRMASQMSETSALVVGSHESLPGDHGFERWPGSKSIYWRSQNRSASSRSPI